MKRVIMVLVFGLLILFQQPALSQISPSQCLSKRWIITLASPASAFEMAQVLQVLSQAQNLFTVRSLSSVASDPSNYSVTFLAETQIPKGSTLDRSQTVLAAEKIIAGVMGMSHTQVQCDGLLVP